MASLGPCPVCNDYTFINNQYCETCKYKKHEDMRGFNTEEMEWRECVVTDFKMLNTKLNKLTLVVFIGFIVLLIDIFCHIVGWL